MEGSLGHWQAARERFDVVAAARPSFAMARTSAALAAFELGDLAAAERELPSLIRRYPLFADARAGLTAGLLTELGPLGAAVVALRVDLDALPIEERTGLSWASK